MFFLAGLNFRELSSAYLSRSTIYGTSLNFHRFRDPVVRTLQPCSADPSCWSRKSMTRISSRQWMAQIMQVLRWNQDHWLGNQWLRCRTTGSPIPFLFFLRWRKLFHSIMPPGTYKKKSKQEFGASKITIQPRIWTNPNWLISIRFFRSVVWSQFIKWKKKPNQMVWFANL